MKQHFSLLHQPLHPDMGMPVVRYLRRFGPIPRLGTAKTVVAGQSVLNALSHLYGDGRFDVYNDVDIFTGKTIGDFIERIRRQHRSSDFHSQTRIKRSIQTSDFVEVFERPSYERRDGRISGGFSLEVRNRYRVLRSIRKGMINEIRCVLYDAVAHDILERFDLNCVQVGVNLFNGQLCWTSQFERFIHSNQMEVVNIDTASATAIRYFKKKREMPFYGDDSYNMQIISTVMKLSELSDFREKPLDPTPQLLFGETYREKYNFVRADLAPYFTMKRCVRAGRACFQLVPRTEVEPKLLKLSSERRVFRYVPFIAHAVLHRHSKFKEQRYKYYLGLDQPDKQKNKTNISLMKFTGSLVATRSHHDFDANLPVSEVARIDRALREHFYLFSRFSVLRNIKEQLALLDIIEFEAGKRGSWVWGFFEKHKIEPAVLLDAAIMSKRLDVEEADMSRTISMAIHSSVYPASIDGYAIKELLSKKDLVEEGDYMRHCVGGYFSALESMQSRIFSIGIPGDRMRSFTLEVTVPGYLRRCTSANPLPTGNQETGIWAIIQAQGFCIRPLNQQETAIINKLVTCLHHAGERVFAGIDYSR